MVVTRRSASLSNAPSAIDLTADDSDEANAPGIASDEQASTGVPADLRYRNDTNDQEVFRGFCRECWVELVEPAVLVEEDDNGVENMEQPRQSAADPATRESYVALIQCACCRRSFRENDEEAFSLMQRTRGSRFRRCVACDSSNTIIHLVNLLTKTGSQDVLASLETSLATIKGEEDAESNSCDISRYEFANRLRKVVAIEDVSRILREAFGIRYRCSWLQRCSPVEDLLYVPQLGDDVVFFPEPYNKFLYKVDAIYNRTCRLYYWDSNPRIIIDRSFAVKCRVINIKYVFPDVDSFDTSRVVMAELTLAVLAIPKIDDDGNANSRKRKRNEQQSGQTAHGVHLFDSLEPKFGQFMGVSSSVTKLQRDQLPSKRHCMTVYCTPQFVSEFLVLDANYEAGVRAGWNVGDRVESTVIDLDQDQEPMYSTRLTGTVVSIDPLPVVFYREITQVLSPCSSIQINWDSQELQEMREFTESAHLYSPWDLEFANENQKYRKQWLEDCSSATHRANSRRISRDGKLQLLSALDRIMAQESFRYFVHLSAQSDDDLLALPYMPDYLYIIANPVDLSLIRARVANDYYRQRESLMGDLMTLYQNTKTYEKSLSRQFSTVETLRESIDHLLEITWPRRTPARGNRVKEVSTADYKSYVYHPNLVIGPAPSIASAVGQEVSVRAEREVEIQRTATTEVVEPELRSPSLKSE